MNNKHWLFTNLRELNPEDQLKKWLVIIVFIAITTYMIPILLPRTPVNGPAIAIVGQVTATDEGKGYGKYCYNGKCEQVKLCTGVSDECGSMVQGPPADYGTGFHTSADGRVRPNPPAGWKWAGK